MSRHESEQYIRSLRHQVAFWFLVGRLISVPHSVHGQDDGIDERAAVALPRAAPPQAGEQ